MIIDENNIARDSFRVTSFEADVHTEARLNYYFGLSQELAGLHANCKNNSIQELQKRGITWVISRTRMEINHYAEWEELINGETWAQKPQLFHCPRLIRCYGKNNRKLFTAKTLWAVIDFTTGRPIRPNVLIEQEIGLPPEEIREDEKLEKLPMFESLAKVEIATYNPRILYLDTDANHHVNNISYINWITEALLNSFRDEYKVSLIDCKWLKQTFRDDTVLVTVGAESDDVLTSDEPKLFFKIEKLTKDGEKERVFEAYTEWKKREAFND